MKRKLIVLLMVVSLLALFVPRTWAWGCPEPVTTTVYVVVSAGGTAAVFPWPLVIMQGAVLLGASPWLLMYHNHPECQDQPTMGDMAACVQRSVKGGK